MGFFSWTTADTGETVWNRYAAETGGPQHRTVYLLQPNGEAPIEEQAYEGYGDFGEVDAHEWLARRNVAAERLAGLAPDRVRSVGVMLACGSYHVDRETGLAWSVFHEGAEALLPDVRHFPGTYAETIPELGATANELIASGRFEQRDFSAFVTTPIKLSFDRHAVYEALPASADCPAQGFFHGLDDEDRDDDHADMDGIDALIDAIEASADGRAPTLH